MERWPRRPTGCEVTAESKHPVRLRASRSKAKTRYVTFEFYSLSTLSLSSANLSNDCLPLTEVSRYTERPHSVSM
jgi:hypothetical protein